MKRLTKKQNVMRQIVLFICAKASEYLIFQHKFCTKRNIFFFYSQLAPSDLSYLLLRLS